MVWIDAPRTLSGEYDACEKLTADATRNRTPMKQSRPLEAQTETVLELSDSQQKFKGAQR